MPRVFFFLGVDPAPSETQRSDDGALVGAAATPKEPGVYTPQPEDWHFDYVYARRFTYEQKASARQWAAYIHKLHRRFRFERIMMDPNQGGRYIERELIEPMQLIDNVLTEVVPIGDMVNGPTKVARGEFILNFWKRGDPGVELLWNGLAGDDVLNDVLYAENKQDLEHGLMSWPAGIEEYMGDAVRKEQLRTWPEERRWSLINLGEMREQYKNIQAATKEDGTYELTSRRAHKFSANGKKDFVSAGMMCRQGFKIWLKEEGYGSQRSEEDQDGMDGW